MKTLEFYRDKSKQHRWRVIARNGRVQATGAEGYRRIGDCIAGAESVLRVELADGKVYGYGYSVHGKKEVGFHEVMNLKFPA